MKNTVLITGTERNIASLPLGAACCREVRSLAADAVDRLSPKAACSSDLPTCSTHVTLMRGCSPVLPTYSGISGHGAQTKALQLGFPGLQVPPPPPSSLQLGKYQLAHRPTAPYSGCSGPASRRSSCSPDSPN
ncbi:hypothetical protein ACFPOG_15690 [Paenibacillus aestuarii]|uniref:Uncharacterized protein n=1 Tax=Paenibacillus aestuarii TaxID=516965 RepID=A0ABW0K8J9_9BACL